MLTDMKVGFDVSDLSTNRADGTTRYTAELAKRMPVLVPDNQWLFYAPGKLVINHSTPPNVTKRIVPWPKYWTQLRLPFALEKDKPDVLFMPIQQLPLLRPRKTKTIAVIHDLAVHRFPEQFTYKDWALLQIFSAQVAHEADHIISVSEATARDIEKYYGRTENVHVVHHGVDHARFRLPDNNERNRSWQLLTERYTKLHKPYLLYIGQIQPRKNLERLIAAFEILRHDNPDLQLVIGGGHGWLQKPILERAKHSPVAENILFLGRVPEDLLPALYWQADVFVLPSLYEGFGMPVLEAMACGCPVVTSNVSSLPEVAGDAAVLVDPNSVESITRGIKEALNDKQSLSTKGIEQAKQFDWDKTARETYKIIASIAAHPSR